MTVYLPGELLQISDLWWSTAVLIVRSFPRERAVDACLIVVGSESAELSLKIQMSPEPDVIQILSPKSADQPFNEWVRAGDKRYGLDFLNLEDSQVRPPAMESKQWVVVRTHVLRERLARSGVIEHATDRHAVDVSRRNTEADDPAREEIHDDHDPVALENNRFTTEQIDVPQAVRCVSDEREPGWTIASRGTSEMLSEDAAHHILADVDTECMGNLLSNSRAPESRITALHLENRGDEFL